MGGNTKAEPMEYVEVIETYDTELLFFWPRAFLLNSCTFFRQSS